MKRIRLLQRAAAGALATLLGATGAQAQVAWTDWTTTGPASVTGTLMFGGSNVTVTYSGPYQFAQTGCGINYWSPNVYTGTGVPNAPGNCEIVALGAGGAKTITFSQAVTNPLLALVSWNGQPDITFNGPIEIVSTGCGYWGCGSMSVVGGMGSGVLRTGGEAHGTIRLLGTYTSITFTDVSEGWHGFTVGATSLASTVPEPSTYALMATGLLALGGVVRHRRRG